MSPKLFLKRTVQATALILVVSNYGAYQSLKQRCPSSVPPRNSRLWVPDPNAALDRPIYVPEESPCTFYARVPKSAFPEPFNLEEARLIWARAFFAGPIIKLEGALAGWFTGVSPSEPDSLSTGTKLAGGVLEVQVPPSATEPLTLSWKNPPGVVRFFEVLASYGYPWRLMEGGRHDLSVEETEGGDVLVGFSSAHDYAVLNGDGKTLPRFGEWSHRAFARFLLNDGVKQLTARDSRSTFS